MTTVGAFTYLDVGAVRIQTYLGRSRHLWGRRGASAVLSARARPARNPDLLSAAAADGVAIGPNPEAPEVDGVVSVVVHSTDQAAVASAATGIARILARDLPGLHLTARSAVAPSYIEAYEVMARATPLLQWLPAQFEYPPCARCEECGQGEAVETLHIVDEDVHACDDCAGRRWGPSRHPALLPEPGVAVGTFTVEADLLEQTGGKATRDFTDLATLGGARGNHLATVAADGNALGQLFSAARRRLAADRGQGRSGDADLQRIRQLSTLVTATTRQALVTATRTIFDPGRGDRLPVVPHILGGDDVLVSVPAGDVWPFVHALLTAFAGGCDEARELAATAERLGVAPPTLSAGVVISHASLPFGQQVTLCEHLLRQAKDHVAGDDFSLAWQDTTWDGTRLVAGRRPMTLTDLSAARPGLDALSVIPQSAQQALAREMDTADLGLAQRRVRSRLARQDDDVAAAVRRYLDCRGRNLLTAEWKAPEMVRLLTDGLSLARWWQ